VKKPLRDKVQTLNLTVEPSPMNMTVVTDINSSEEEANPVM
jgi:hypothetical protein